MGCADRSAYDLTQHTKATGIRLAAEKKLSEPKIVDCIEAVSNKGLLGKTFKKEAKQISEALASLTVTQIDDLEKELQANK